MKKKLYHVADVLTITTRYLLSPRGVPAIYDILNFMSGDDLFTHQLPRVAKECTPYLLEQFPQLDSPEMKTAVAELVAALVPVPSENDAEINKMILDWTAKLTSGQFGIEVSEMLEVQQLPAGVHQAKNPLSELAEMLGPKKPIVVVDAG